MLRVDYAGPTNLHPYLIRQTDFLVLNSRRSALTGIYYGLVLAMVLYNLAMFVSLKDNSYLWYGFYVLAMAFYFMFLNGILAGAGPRIHLFFLGMIFVGGAQFTRHFFMTKKVLPWADKLFLAYLGLSLILFAGSLFLPPLPLFGLGILGGVGPLLSILVGITLWRGGFAGARFFVLAWFLLSIGICLFILTIAGVIPVNSWSFHAFQTAAALEALILSLSLADRIKGVEKSRRLFEKQALTDTLTGLFNKRHFETQLELHHRRIKRKNGELSLIMMDVDDFKQINDKHGHPQGDVVLARLGKVIRTSLRDGDIACRYGGEEFSVILPDTSLEIAREIAERIRKTAASQVFAPARPLSSFNVTLSLGVAAWQEGKTAQDLVAMADAALYKAKSRGKNQAISS
jgi:diguanylate cyclase (GGDEF)-like protein